MRRIFFGAAVGLVACAALFAARPLAAHAADPLFMMTWESDNYAPAWFAGKKFPVELSSVRVSFEMVGQNKGDYGKLVDLSGSEIRWYLKGELVQRSTGGQSMIIKNRDFDGNSIEVKVSAQYPDPVSGKKYFVDHWIDIPIKRPEVVIRSIAPSAPLAAASYEAVPFFFNAFPASLDTQWIVNGTERPTGDSGNRFIYSVRGGDVTAGGFALQGVIRNGTAERASRSYRVAGNGASEN